MKSRAARFNGAKPDSIHAAASFIFWLLMIANGGSINLPLGNPMASIIAWLA